MKTFSFFFSFYLFIYFYKNEDFSNITRLNKAYFFYALDTWEHITSIRSQVFNLKRIETCGGDHILTFL